MAKIEKVTTTRIEENKFDFEDLISFQTENYVGEWFPLIERYVVFDKSDITDFSSDSRTVYAEDLEELVYKVKHQLCEEITDVYDEHTIYFSVKDMF